MFSSSSAPSPSRGPEGHARGSGREAESDWHFLQCFGERTPGEEIQDADIISAVEFDADGSHLATGDKGGRVVLFERVEASSSREQQQQQEGGGVPVDVDWTLATMATTPATEPDPDVRPPSPRSDRSNPRPPFEYRYLTEFQSHEPEFDYLKSLEIEEKINKVRWARRNVAGCSISSDDATSTFTAGSANGRLLLSTNDKTIKLWRVSDRRVVTLAGFNTAHGALGGGGEVGVGGLGSGGGSPAAGDLIGVGRMPPSSPSSAAEEEAGAGAAPSTSTPWSIAASARASDPLAPPDPTASPSSRSPPMCEADDERIGNKIKAFGISSSSSIPPSPERNKSGGKERTTPPPPPSAILSLPRVVASRAVLSARLRRKFAGAHAYHVNALSMCSDGETFLSADDLRVQLWHLDAPPRESRRSGGGGGGRSGRRGSNSVDHRIDEDCSPSSSSSFSCSSSPFFFDPHEPSSLSPSTSSPRSSCSSSTPFVIVDMKPACMDDLAEVITAAEFHPSHCSLFAHASSRGAARVCDMRSAALCDRPAVVLEPPGLSGGPNGAEANSSFFSEITASLSDVRWCGRGHDGRRLATRDYLSVTIWDLAMPSRPVASYPVHDCLRPRLADLYENDCVFDKFGLAVSGDGRSLASGTYSSLFRVVPGVGRSGSSDRPSNSPGVLLEASRDPRRRRALSAASAGAEGGGADEAAAAAAANAAAAAALGPPPGLGRYGLAPSYESASNSGSGGGFVRGGPDDDSADAVGGDLSAKMLHLAWHPGCDVIAAAASNSLYLYYNG